MDDAVFFAAVLAFFDLLFTESFAFLTVDLALSAAFAAAWTFFATATDNPAFCSALGVEDASFAIESILAAVNFLAVAAPTPGREVSPWEDEGALPAIIPLNCPYMSPNFNLPPVENGPEWGFFMILNLLVQP